MTLEELTPLVEKTVEFLNAIDNRGLFVEDHQYQPYVTQVTVRVRTGGNVFMDVTCDKTGIISIS